LKISQKEVGVESALVDDFAILKGHEIVHQGPVTSRWGISSFALRNQISFWLTRGIQKHRLAAATHHFGAEGEGVGTYNILTSLFRKSKKKPICTPKTINEAPRAVRKATRLIPLCD